MLEPRTPVTEVPDYPVPNRDEKRNGWTETTLRAYLEQRRQEQIDYAGTRKRPAVTQDTRGFDPHGW